MKFSITGQEHVLFNTGDCLIEVTAWDKFDCKCTSTRPVSCGYT